MYTSEIILNPFGISAKLERSITGMHIFSVSEKQRDSASKIDYSRINLSTFRPSNKVLTRMNKL